MGWVAKMLLSLSKVPCCSIQGITSHRTQKPRDHQFPGQAVNGSKGAKEWSLKTLEEVRGPLGNSPVRQKQRQEPL